VSGLYFYNHLINSELEKKKEGRQQKLVLAHSAPEAGLEPATL
jgi:hypothetical protein